MKHNKFEHYFKKVDNARENYIRRRQLLINEEINIFNRIPLIGKIANTLLILPFNNNFRFLYDLTTNFMINTGFLGETPYLNFVKQSINLDIEKLAVFETDNIIGEIFNSITINFVIELSDFKYKFFRYLLKLAIKLVSSDNIILRFIGIKIILRIFFGINLFTANFNIYYNDNKTVITETNVDNNFFQNNDLSEKRSLILIETDYCNAFSNSTLDGTPIAKIPNLTKVKIIELNSKKHSVHIEWTDNKGFVRNGWAQKKMVDSNVFFQLR